VLTKLAKLSTNGLLLLLKLAAKEKAKMRVSSKKLKKNLPPFQLIKEKLKHKTKVLLLKLLHAKLI